MTKRISLIQSTKLVKKDLEVGVEEEPVFKKMLKLVGVNNHIKNTIEHFFKEKCRCKIWVVLFLR